jgi:ABC-2 type transport system ATP-binding protein
MSAVIQCQNLSVQYGSKYAVRQVNLTLQPGQILGLIGPNGAGKTNLLKAILGLTPYSGEIQVLGLDPFKQRDAMLDDVCFVADVAILPRWMSVGQAIDYTAGVHPKFSREKCLANLARNPDIQLQQKIRELSKGMVAQVHLAIVLAIDAKLLILDEPTLGLDLLFRRRFYDQLIGDYFDNQRSIIITTHQVEELQHMLSEVAFIKGGELVLHSDMERLSQRFTEVMVKASELDAARALGPLHERRVFGRHVFLFDGVDSGELQRLGETNAPSVADLFIATMEA